MLGKFIAGDFIAITGENVSSMITYILSIMTHVSSMITYILSIMTHVSSLITSVFI
jgi:hypothetical protein